MKNAIFWDVAFLRSMLRLLATADVVPSSLILVTLMMVVICSSETLVLTRATQSSIPEDSILQGKEVNMFLFLKMYP
jgi:hypothetical protein